MKTNKPVFHCYLRSLKLKSFEKGGGGGGGSVPFPLRNLIKSSVLRFKIMRYNICKFLNDFEEFSTV